MLNFIIKRVLNAFITIFCVITVVFFLTKLAPGSPFASDKITPEVLESLNQKYGFDRNLFIQYLDYLSNLFFDFDFGLSTKDFGVRINDILFPSNGNGGFFLSIKFGLLVVVVSTIFGIFLGICAAINKNGFIDRLISIFSIIGLTVPVIIIAPLLVLLFSVYFGFFPPTVSGMSFRDMFLPVLTLSFPNICILAQIQRDSFIDVLKRPFILTARSKGLSKFRIFMKHALKPSLVPSIGFLGPTIASILSGTVFVESFFGFPGLGTLTIQAALYRNYNMILALVIIYSVMLILCNLVVDILYGYLDPRMRVR